MTLKPLVLYAATGAFSVLLPQAAQAETSGWRCDGADCQDSLLNDIEDATTARWPTHASVAMPTIQYACEGVSTGGATVTGQVAWSFDADTTLPVFVLGRHLAAPTIAGQLTATGGVTGGGDAAFAYGLATGPNVVMQGIDTGVSDLGDIQSFVTSGGLWNSKLSFRVNAGTGSKTCQIKLGAATFSATPNGARVVLPVALPAVQREIGQAIAAALRAQFEGAVLHVAVGLP